MSRTLNSVLAELGVPRDRVIYLHTSADWLRRLGIGVGEAVDSLVDWIDQEGGTLVMPTFPFRGSHEAYLAGDPLFDVRRTPCRVGLVNEVLRRRTGSRRSLDPDLSVVAFGREANGVVGSIAADPDPMGAASAFQRIIDYGGVLVGLGVSTNYMNMIHVIDSRYADRYPVKVMSAISYPARTRDLSGQLHHVVRRAIPAPLQTHIRPSRILSVLAPSDRVFRGLELAGVSCFLWELPDWERLCVAHVESALAAHTVPCWLTEAEPYLIPKCR